MKYHDNLALIQQTHTIACGLSLLYYTSQQILQYKIKPCIIKFLNNKITKMTFYEINVTNKL